MSNLFVIVNWNNTEDTMRCLHLIFNGLGPNSSVLLIDNGSKSTNYLEELETQTKSLQIIRNSENIGFTLACNQAFDYAIKNHFNYISFINNDAFISDSFHENLNRQIHFADAGMICCKLVLNESEDILDNIGHQMLNTGEIIPLAYHEKASSYRAQTCNLGSCAAATVYSVDMVKDIGFYDPYFRTGYEDAEFGVRAILAGYKSIFLPDLVVKHKVSVSVKKVDDLDYRIQQQVNIYYSYLKLMPLMVICINLPFILVKYFLVLIVELITFKWRYIDIHIRTLVKLFAERRKILKARREFMENRKLISSFKFLSMQRFFLGYDLQRLIDYIFRSKKNVFDRSLEKV